MDAYDKCTNLGGKNLADSVAIYGRGQELFRPQHKCYFWCGNNTSAILCRSL